MIAYLDTSSIVKLYKDEQSSDEVERLVEVADAVATSRLAYVEVRSAFALAKRVAQSQRSSLQVRGHPLDTVESAYSRMVSLFESDWSSRRFTLLGVRDGLIRAAGFLCNGHSLRAYDAVHVASALRLANIAPDEVRFSSFDPRQLVAANSEGLSLAH